MKKLNKLLSISILPFEVDVRIQKQILNRYEYPKDLIERSYFQYTVQFQLAPLYKRILNNFIGFLAIFYFLIKATVFFQKKSKIKFTNESKLLIYPYKNYHYPDIIPAEIKEEFQIHAVDFMSGYKLSKNDFAILYELCKRHPFQFYFLSKCISKILFFRHIVDHFQPNAILSCAEYSFSSSVSTQFCRDNHVEHINIMHGEKFFLMRDSFFEFDRFYVWDEFYKNLFIKLKAVPNQFVIGTFNNLKMNLQPNREIYNYTYYLAAEKTDELIQIKNSLLKLDDPKMVCVRYHPRYSSVAEINNIFGELTIENPIEISMKESFNRTRGVISLYSTCLTQAIFNDKQVIIDDVNNSESKIQTLKDSEYIIFSKPHQLLSQLLK